MSRISLDWIQDASKLATPNRISISLDQTSVGGIRARLDQSEADDQDMLISISRYLAIVLGILTPLAETIRRWHTWRENPPAFFDDYIIGAFLLFGAWRTGKNVSTGRPILAAAWAFLCGMAYVSFFVQLEDIRLGIADPAPISSGAVAAIKGVGLAIGVMCLVFSLWPTSSVKRGQS